MKKKNILIGAVCVLALGLLAACGSTTTSSGSGSGEEAADATIVTDISVSGTWTSSKGKTFEFTEDGTYTDNSKNSVNAKRQGTYEIVEENSGFTISYLFDSIEYLVCTNSKGTEAATCAVLQDVMIIYSELDNEERYYFRDGRDEVTQDMLVGAWIDVNDADSILEFNEDGTLDAFDQTSNYVLEQTEYGTCVNVSNDDDETQYIIAPYENYLIMVIADTTSLYMLAQQ